MTREQFREIVAEAIETVTAIAEQRLGRILPRSYALRWLGGPVIDSGDDVVELITGKVFVTEDKVYPCVDLFLDDLLSDGRLLITSYRGCYQPGPYGQHWQFRTGGHCAGRVGPFKLGCTTIVEKLSIKR